MEKFPDHIDIPQMGNGSAREPSPLHSPSTYSNGSAAQDRWLPVPRRDNGHANGRQWSAAGRGHGRQKSLSDAFRTIRARNGSISQNAQEIADALKAPVSPKLVVCILYTIRKEANLCQYHDVAFLQH